MNSLLESPAMQRLLERTPRTLVVDAVRQAIAEARQASSDGGGPRTPDDWAAAVAHALSQTMRFSLRPVLNGTGVVLHTNLGRAALAPVALEAMVRVGSGFSNLEYDVERGERGSRSVHCAAILRELTGAEDALVVNNGAAALVLVLNTFARGRGAIVSRGELVEIGGSFRIPEIMERSGARLVEVGTTNRTKAADYAGAMDGETGLLVKVHRSNFAMAGFVAETSAAELKAIGQKHNVPVLHDLGSGLLISLDAIGLKGEPTVREALAAGADVVTMSGDKLLGGPQAGIIVGRADLVAAVKKNPLARALRVDKFTLAALEATLSLYREPARAMREIPVLAQLGVSVADLRTRGEAIAERLRGCDASIVESEASVGGGAYPAAAIPSIALSIGHTQGADRIEQALREAEPAVIARVADGRVLIDLRTIFPEQDSTLERVLSAVLS